MSTRNTTRKATTKPKVEVEEEIEEIEAPVKPIPKKEEVKPIVKEAEVKPIVKETEVEPVLPELVEQEPELPEDLEFVKSAPKSIYVSITKAATLFDKFLIDNKLETVQPIFHTKGKVYKSKDFAGQEGAILNKKLATVFINAPKPGCPKYYKVKDVFGVDTVYISIEAKKTPTYADNEKDCYIKVGEKKTFNKDGNDITFYRYELSVPK